MLIISIGLDITFSFNKDFGGLNRLNGPKWIKQTVEDQKTKVDQNDQMDLTRPNGLYWTEPTEWTEQNKIGSKQTE